MQTPVPQLVLAAVERGMRQIEDFGEVPRTLIDLAYPPRVQFGDFTINCFGIAEHVYESRQHAHRVAAELARVLGGDSVFAEVNAHGPYVNVRVQPAILFGNTVQGVLDAGERFGRANFGQSTSVMVEYLSPNTNKPLHLGHLRNGVLGMALVNLFEATGHTVVAANLVNDRGVHICKSMYAYQEWGEGKTPESAEEKGDHFVGKWYVKFGKRANDFPYIEEEAQALLRRWEDGDPEVLALWGTMNRWAMAGFEETYRRFGFRFDVLYKESETYRLGKELVGSGLERGILSHNEEGAVIANVPTDRINARLPGRKKKGEEPAPSEGGEEKFHPSTLLRSDGTSLYMTQDLGTAVRKFREHNLSTSIYVVGSEQEFHFACLFTILEMLGYETWARGCHHFSYGMVNLPEGKMKSREGTVVDADDMADEVVTLVVERLREQGDLSEYEIMRRAEVIGIGAIKFYLARMHPRQAMLYDPKESLDLEGFTGPYCQYAFARCQSIVARAREQEITHQPDFSLLGSEDELLLVQNIMRFSEIVERATWELDPSLVAQHTYEIARMFNRFYHSSPVVGAGTRELAAARLYLTMATAVVIQNGLRLLGIDTLEAM